MKISFEVQAIIADIRQDPMAWQLEQRYASKSIFTKGAGRLCVQRFWPAISAAHGTCYDTQWRYLGLRDGWALLKAIRWALRVHRQHITAKNKERLIESIIQETYRTHKGDE